MRIRPVVPLTMVAGALIWPGSVLALGLGKLTVESSLGQPLSARIELTSASKEELDSLSAKVADPGLYRQNNLAYQAVLARARVTLERTANGQAYLNVVTTGAVNEPYLDLMVEMNWAAGRVVREYTFLLDPPGVAPQPVEPVAPVRSGTPPPRAAVAAPAAPAATAPSQPSGAGRASGTGAGAASQAGGATYTVKRGDTLSRIAGDNKPEAVTLEQMLVALWKRNEQAFDGNNLNRLRSGAIMTLPSADEAASASPTEASGIVRLQASEWRTYRDRVAAGAPSSEGAGTRGGGGKIGTVVEETAPAAAAGRDQLRVSREAAAGKNGASAAAESAIARDKQIREQQERITDLEKTIKDLQRVAELKSQTLAQMQAQAEQKAPAAKAPAAPTPDTKAAEAPKSAPPAAKAAEAPSTPITAPAPAPAPKAEPVAKAEPTPAPKTDPAAAAKAANAKAEPPKPAPSFFDDLLANVPTWAIGGGALVLLGGIAALIAARRRKPAKFDDGITTDTDIKANTVFGSTGGGVVNTGDNSLSSEFSREGLGNIDTDEVDPIAEAEVYLAYGRDAQAEEILKDALRKDPQRQEVYLKLLEIHAQHNKPSSFETVAAELYAISHGQGDVWQKAVALGRQLDPANPMFAEGMAGGTEQAGKPGDTQAFSVPPELTSEVTVGGDARATATPAERDRDVNYDLTLDDDVAQSATAARLRRSNDSAAAPDLAKAPRVGPVTTSPAFARGGAAAATAALVDGIARPRSVPTPPEPPAREKVEPTTFIPDLEFRLDDPPAFAPAAEPAPAAAAPATSRADFDKLELAFNDERSTFEDATPSVLDGQWHDAATKLDLAKAYQEMGDVEGAREILQEVLREGDDEQKTEAQALIGKLG